MREEVVITAIVAALLIVSAIKCRIAAPKHSKTSEWTNRHDRSGMCNRGKFKRVTAHRNQA